MFDRAGRGRGRGRDRAATRDSSNAGGAADDEGEAWLLVRHLLVVVELCVPGRHIGTAGQRDVDLAVALVQH